MADLQEMSRVLYHHQWADVEDWARNLAELADLSDDEIGQLQCCCRTGPCSEDVRTHSEPESSSSPRRMSLVDRTRHCLAFLRLNIRLPLRRTC